jgi:hypothetical protein
MKNKCMNVLKCLMLYQILMECILRGGGVKMFYNMQINSKILKSCFFNFFYKLIAESIIHILIYFFFRHYFFFFFFLLDINDISN